MSVGPSIGKRRLACGFPCYFKEYLGMVVSDHRLIVAYLGNKVPWRRRQFMFDKRWIGHDGLLESIGRGWGASTPENSWDFVSKIINCCHEIATWRKNNPSYGKERISELQKALEEVQTDNNRTQENILEVSRKLQKAYKDDEEFWHQKSRNMWHTSRNLNTKFYHVLTKQRRTRNSIVGLYNTQENWIIEEHGVENIAVDYFDDLFQITSPSEFEEFLDEIKPTITPQMNQRLIRLATKEEIQQALFMMYPEKALGPDVTTALFFQHFWHLIKKDLLEMVNNLFWSQETWIQG